MTIAADGTDMGTMQEATLVLANKAREWRMLRQPVMATAKELKDLDRRDHQLRFEICNAALHWLWHLEN